MVLVCCPCACSVPQCVHWVELCCPRDSSKQHILVSGMVDTAASPESSGVTVRYQNGRGAQAPVDSRCDADPFVLSYHLQTAAAGAVKLVLTVGWAHGAVLSPAAGVSSAGATAGG